MKKEKCESIKFDVELEKMRSKKKYEIEGWLEEMTKGWQWEKGKSFEKDND